MTFGLIVSNDKGYVQIDSETPRLCAIYSGAYSASGTNNVTIVFPQPVGSVEPPCVFIRNSPDQPSIIYSGLGITGAPGNWTGFNVSTMYNYDRPQGKWFVAVFASQSTADWGLRMWGENSNVIYDSGAAAVIFTKATNQWAFQANVPFPSYGSANYYRAQLSGTLAVDEYYMINPFSRGVLAPQQTLWSPSGVTFDYSNNTLLMYSFGFTAGWIDPGAPAAVFARLPGT